MSVILKHKVKVLGIGGAGCAIVDAYLDGCSDKNDCCVMDGDNKLLFMSRCVNKISLDGFADAVDFAFELRDKFAEFVSDACMLVIVAGLGGSVGSRFTKSVADIVLNQGVTVAVVAVKPFPEEGKDRLTEFERSYRELSECGCSVMLLSNCGLENGAGSDSAISGVIAENNEKIVYAVKSLVGAFNSDNLDASDARAVFGGKRDISFCYGFAAGRGKTQTAALGALSSPATKSILTDKRRVIFYIRSKVSASLDDVQKAVAKVNSLLQKDAYVFLSLHYDDSMPESLVQVSLIAT